MDKTIAIFNKTGQQVFYNPNILIDYDKLAKSSLGSNTYRGFHKIDKTKPGSKEAFEKVLTNNSKFITDSLLAAKTENDLDNLETEICKTLKKELKKNINNLQLDSFNKLRKPIDIVIEHLVSMGKDFATARLRITKHLFLPLDSQMFKSQIVFSDKEITELKLKRSFTFKDIVDKAHYYEIQNFLKRKANVLELENRIYFDLAWNNRYKSEGKYLFATNQ